MLKNKNKGITLVALVITIIILLILAGISISALTNTGIFGKAKDAKNASDNAEKEQGQTLSEYEDELNRYMPQELTEDKINKVLSKTENTILKDTNGNIFTLPAGFKVVVNDDTNNAKTVDKGIVIEALGRGNVPPAMVDGIKRALNNNIPVVIVSRCFEGRVYESYGYDGGGKMLKDLGVFFEESMPGQKARIKLIVALSSEKAIDIKESFMKKVN